MSAFWNPAIASSYFPSRNASKALFAASAATFFEASISACVGCASEDEEDVTPHASSAAHRTVRYRMSLPFLGKARRA